MGTKSFKIQGLDGLRAIAALAVLGYHIFNQSLDSGFLGIDLFFVLSGFLITSLLINEFEQNDSIDLKNFWLKRFRRLFPAIAFCIIICVPTCFFLNKDLLVNIKSEIIGALTFTYNWVQIFSHHDYFDRLNEQFLQNVWTLSLEEQFYLIWPLLLLVLLRTRFLKILLPLILAGISVWLMWYLGQIGADKTRIYEGSDTHSFGLMLGAILALAYPDAFVTGEKNETKKIFGREIGIMLERNIMVLRALYGWVSFIGIFVLFGLNINFNFIYPWGILLMSLFGIGIIQACFWDVNYLTGFLVKILELPLLVWLGKRSYALYLWHWPICLLVNNMLPANLDFANAIIATVLSILFAAISYEFVEEPMRRDGIINTLKNYAPTSWGEKPSLIVPVSMLCIAIIPTIFAIIFAPKETSVAKQVKEEVRILNILQDKQTNTNNNIQIIYTVKQSEENTRNANLKIAEKADEAKGANITFRVVSYEDALKAQENNQTGAIIVTSDEIFALHNGIKSDEIVIVGDSITLSAATLIKANLPQTLIDAEISRNAESGIKTVKELKEKGLLQKYLIFSLGTNGIFTHDQAQELLDSVDYSTKIIFVTAHGPASKKWISGSNDTMREFATLYPDRIKIAEWEAAVKHENNAFHSDNIHPNKKGATIYIETIMNTLNEF